MAYVAWKCLRQCNKGKSEPNCVSRHEDALRQMGPSCSLCNSVAHSNALVPFSWTFYFLYVSRRPACAFQMNFLCTQSIRLFTLRSVCSLQCLGFLHLDLRIFLTFPHTPVAVFNIFLRTQFIRSFHFAARLRILRHRFLSVEPRNFLQVSTHWLLFPSDFPSHPAHWFRSLCGSLSYSKTLFRFTWTLDFSVST